MNFPALGLSLSLSNHTASFLLTVLQLFVEPYSVVSIANHFISANIYVFQIISNRISMRSTIDRYTESKEDHHGEKNPVKELQVNMCIMITFLLLSTRAKARPCSLRVLFEKLFK